MILYLMRRIKSKTVYIRGEEVQGEGRGEEKGGEKGRERGEEKGEGVKWEQ